MFRAGRDIYPFFRRGNGREYYLVKIIYCPDCGNRLYAHGNCKRLLRWWEENEEGELALVVITLYLKVVECRCCHKTHRLIPEEVIPYKQYAVIEYARRCNDHEPGIVDNDYRRIRIYVIRLMESVGERVSIKDLQRKYTLEELVTRINELLLFGGKRVA